MVYKNIRNLLIIVLVTVWTAVFLVPSPTLKIITCDVGQGDATLIQKNNTQILIDGGPGNRVMDCLGKYIPFWDREIELVILTHAEKDHYGGLIEVTKRYNVQHFGEYRKDSSSLDYQVLQNEVGSKGTNTVVLHKGTHLRIGLIYLDILHPNDGTISKNRNDDGVVTLLKYDNFKALFAADVEDKVSDSIAEVGLIKNVDYIKINHHGSKNGISEKLIQFANPKFAVISVGKENRYGHPDSEVIDLLNKYKINYFRTDILGDIVYEVK